MQSSKLPAHNISIYRHCMQQLIHQALLLEQADCRGFLAGSGHTIQATVAEADRARTIAPSTLQGIYHSTDDQGQSDLEAVALLQRRFTALTGRFPDYYMVLQCAHKGRMDALLFSDRELTRPLELEMQEDGDLYPIPASS